MINTETFTQEEKRQLLKTLKSRFEENIHRHKNLDWAEIQNKLEKKPEYLWSLQQMEETGGEPDVVAYDKQKDAYLFYDCCPESPKGRRSLCYDREALESRKKHKPQTSAIEMSTQMGIEILSENQYQELQQLGDFDTKTSSWLLTPPEVRQRGGAIFGDRRYGRVFTYHNGADSYYSARGFRACLMVR